MFRRHRSDKLLYPLLIAFILIIISYRTSYRLRPEMPAVFYSESAPYSSQPRIDLKRSKTPNLPNRELQREIAMAYWRVAQTNVQYKFSYGHPLPGDIPAEFSIAPGALGPNASDPAIRLFYWRRLQEVWFLPEIWNKNHEWDWSWVGDPISSGAQWIKDFVDRWFAMHGPR
jgi:hypothetical protein